MRGLGRYPSAVSWLTLTVDLIKPRIIWEENIILGVAYIRLAYGIVSWYSRAQPTGGALSPMQINCIRKLAKHKPPASQQVTFSLIPTMLL